MSTLQSSFYSVHHPLCSSEVLRGPKLLSNVKLWGFTMSVSIMASCQQQEKT